MDEVVWKPESRAAPDATENGRAAMSSPPAMPRDRAP